MPTLLEPNSVRIWHRDTPRNREIYPTLPGERASRQQAAQLARRVVTGPVSADADEFIHSWTQDDYTGGIGIKDANESTDTARIEFGMGVDVTHPRHMALEREVTYPTKPSWATGGAYPLGDIGTQFYVGWGNGIAGFDIVNNAFYTTQNTWPASFVIAEEPVLFCGKLFVPGGSTGFCFLTELTAATGTLTVSTRNTAILARCFAVHDNLLWAIDTSNKLWFLTPTGVAAGAITTANWGSGTYAGAPVTHPISTAQLVLDTSVTPTEMINWFNSEQKEALWCITRGQGAYIFDPDEPRWIQTVIKPGTHPDWGICCEVFRDGEDLLIAGGGLDLTRETTSNVEVPLSGLSKDQGVLPSYNGTIWDLCSERSKLYALIKGLPFTQSVSWVEDPDGGEHPYVIGTPVPMWLASWTGTAWYGVWEDLTTSGEPTWMRVSMNSTDPAIWWGGTDGIIRKMAVPPPFLNPAARITLGQYPFTTSGWIQTVRYDSNMSGWDKVASHAFTMMDFATEDTYVDVSYRTDGDQFINGLIDPPWTPWKRIDGFGRSLLWFDDTDLDTHTGLPRREGLQFQWIQFRFDFVRGDDRFVSPLWMWHSLHHLIVPQDAASIVVKVPLDFDRNIYNRSPDEVAETLLGLQRRRGLIWLQTHNPRRAGSGEDEKQVFFRTTISNVKSEMRMGANNNLSEIIVLSFLEIGAADLAHTHEATSL